MSLDSSRKSQGLDVERNSGKQDILVATIGEFGKFQLKSVLLMGITSITYSWINFVNKFLTYDVDYWCQRVNQVVEIT